MSFSTRSRLTVAFGLAAFIVSFAMFASIGDGPARAANDKSKQGLCQIEGLGSGPSQRIATPPRIACAGNGAVAHGSVGPRKSITFSLLEKAVGVQVENTP